LSEKEQNSLWDFGCEIAHAAVSRRPPISLYTIVARTGGYTYDAKVWDWSIVQFGFCRAEPLLTLRFVALSLLYTYLGRVVALPIQVLEDSNLARVVAHGEEEVGWHDGRQLAEHLCDRSGCRCVRGATRVSVSGKRGWSVATPHAVSARGPILLQALLWLASFRAVDVFIVCRHSGKGRRVCMCRLREERGKVEGYCPPPSDHRLAAAPTRST
jgi:hypothetical protein